MPAGAPTKYKQEYCQMLIDHMAQGLSFKSFAGLISVNYDTLFEWCKVHSEFSESKKIGQPKSLYMYEKTIWAATHGKIENFNNTAAVWFGKNVHGWTDKQEVSIDAGKIEINISDNESKL